MLEGIARFIFKGQGIICTLGGLYFIIAGLVSHSLKSIILGIILGIIFVVMGILSFKVSDS